MVAISAGTQGLFKSVTAEGRAIEALVYLQNLERNTTNNPDGFNALTGSFDTEEGVFSGTYSLPAVQQIAVGGVLQIQASTYLQSSTVAPGGDSPTFVSTRAEAYVLEVLMYLQFLERQPSRNPQNRNYVTGTFNSDTGIYQGTFNLPITITLDAEGKPLITATEYISSP